MYRHSYDTLSGPPVMNEHERYAAVSACKWVDEIVENAPYVTQLDVINQYDIDFVVHGEDVSLDEHGNDTYALVKQAGKYKQIKRSEGVSTTEIVGRMVLCTKDHLNAALALDFHKTHSGTRSPTIANRKLNNNNNNNNHITEEQKQDLLNDDKSLNIYNHASHYLPSTKLITLFAHNEHSVSNPQRIVYIDGAFDLFHVGHLSALQQAKSLGDYLIVGVHSDAVVNAIKGNNLPILNLQERALSVLSCRYVDEVVFSAPWSPTVQQLQQLRVDIVAHGTCSDYPDNVPDPYQAAKQLNIWNVFTSEYPTMTTSTIIQRIIDNRHLYAERNKKKAKSLETILQQQKEEYEHRMKTT